MNSFSKHQKSPKHRWNTSGRKSTPAFKKNRVQAILRDQGICFRCEHFGYITLGQEVDHWINLSAGGSDDLENLGYLCGPCHRRKTVREASGRTGFGTNNIIDPVTGFYLTEPDDQYWMDMLKARTNEYLNRS